MNEIIEQVKEVMDHNFFWSYLCFFPSKKDKEDYADFGVALEYALDYSTNGLIERVVGNNGWDFYLNVDTVNKIPIAIGEAKNTSTNSIVVKNYIGNNSNGKNIEYPQLYFVCQAKAATKTKPASKILYAIDGREMKTVVEKFVEDKIQREISKGKKRNEVKFSTISVNINSCKKTIVSVGDVNMKLKPSYENAYELKRKFIFENISNYCTKAVEV